MVKNRIWKDSYKISSKNLGKETFILRLKCNKNAMEVQSKLERVRRIDYLFIFLNGFYN